MPPGWATSSLFATFATDAPAIVAIVTTGRPTRPGDQFRWTNVSILGEPIFDRRIPFLEENRDQIRVPLEAAGIEFIDENGGGSWCGRFFRSAKRFWERSVADLQRTSHARQVILTKI